VHLSRLLVRPETKSTPESESVFFRSGLFRHPVFSGLKKRVSPGDGSEDSLRLWKILPVAPQSVAAGLSESLHLLDCNK